MTGTRKTLGILAGAVAALVLAGGALAATYPDPPPDFSHPDSFHKTPMAANDPVFGSLGGQADRHLLVIYARWDDLDYPPEFDAAEIARRFFGTGFPSITFPSVGDYFRRLSFNDMFLAPALETQGTANDGVVQVHVPGTRDEFFELSQAARNRRLAQLADPYVDFSVFDADGNGSLTDLELVLNSFEVEPPSTLPWQGCGITRGIDGISLDGTALGGLHVAMNNTATNLITIIHENAHVALHMTDLYGFVVGRMDVGGATCKLSDDTLFAPSAWHKLHWGWITPTVVTRDGYYEIRRADTTGDAFILYDPDSGTSDYFLVENRRREGGTYDQGASDSGLVIWRIDDDALGFDVPIGLMRPRETSGPDAWDAARPLTPQRTMAQPWTDGTDSRVAVRAIGAAGDVMRAYFDVRGPGVLVDTFPVDRSGPVRLTAGGSTMVDVPVQNTGEACDTFVFEPVQLPPGWTMSPGARILCAGESSFARMFVTPDANAAVGLHAIAVRGRSLSDASVVTEAPLSVEVVLRPTKFGFGALDVAAPTGTATTFEIRVGSADDPLEPPVAGVPVTFTLTGGDGAITARATTNADGVATAAALLTLAPGTYSLTIETERTGQYAATSTTVPFTIERRPTTLEAGPAFIANGLPGTLGAVLTDDLGGAPIGGRPVTLTIGAIPNQQSCVDPATDAAGRAECPIPAIEQPLGPVPLSASFGGDDTYLPSAASVTTVVFQWTQNGSFVIGDGNVGVGSTATFWSSKWSRLNTVSGGPAPSAFKGFASDPPGPTTCGAPGWSASGGNSPSPPATVPAYTAVLVTSKVTKSGSSINGTKPAIAVVKVDPGYGPSPGTTGSAVVLGMLCD